MKILYPKRKGCDTQRPCARPRATLRHNLTSRSGSTPSTDLRNLTDSTENYQVSGVVNYAYEYNTRFIDE